MADQENVHLVRDKVGEEVRPFLREPGGGSFEMRQKAPTILSARRAIFTIMTLLAGVACLRAQDEHKRKLPVIDKITTTNGQEAFSGAIQSLDLKTSLLLVHSTRDNTDEYFPVKKNVHVATADGQRVPLDKLRPGVSVLVYYEEKGDRRAVKEIVVLGGPAATPKEKAAPPS